MKMILSFFVIAFTAVTFCACNSNNHDTSAIKTSEISDTQIPSTENITKAESEILQTTSPYYETENSENNVSEQDEEIKLNIIIGNQTFTAALYNNQTTQEFIDHLPVTLNMSELNGNEKYNYLPYNLTEDSQSPEIINSGDLMLYNDNCLVLFYKTFSTSYSYTKLGYIDNPENLENAVGNGNIQITFEIMN